MSVAITLRNVQIEELESLSQLCLRSKAVWGYDEAFMAACRTELTLQSTELDSTHLQVAAAGAIVIGLVQLTVIGDEAHLLKLFVEPGHLKSGIGRLLLDWAKERARACGARRMIIEADPDAVGFYHRCGAHLYGLAHSGSIPGRMLPRLMLDL